MQHAHATDFGRALQLLARERLTDRQRRILRYLATTSVTASVAARNLEERLACSSSTVWTNLAALRRAGLVRYPSRGMPIMLTNAGMHVIDHLAGEPQCEK